MPFKNLFCIIFLVGVASFSNAQVDHLSPLKYNFELTKQVQKFRAPDIFIYEIDTLALPFLDEFSSDLFKKYNAQPGQSNVTTQTEYHLYDFAGTTVLHDSTRLMLSRTFYIATDTVGGDTITTMTPLDSTVITIYDLSAYPFTSLQDTVWPRYNIYDTLYQASSPDTIYYPVPDLLQDSVKVHFVSSIGDNSLWQDSYAYWNTRYPIAPPTIGVATFDGLDDSGYPYDFVNSSSIGVADYMTSKPIYLGTKPNNTPYNASDSLYLSFFYQPQGRGNAPETGDSLILEFWAPDSAQWFHVWSTPGTALHDFKQVMVKINPFFLQDGFQFRFKNIANLAGSLDHWHLDYIYLNLLRNQNDTVRADVAFMYDENTLLKDYTTMPWEHYQINPSLFMADTLSVYQRNNDNVARIIADQFLYVYHKGVQQAVINGPLHPSIPARSNFSTVYDLQTAGFEYDPLVADTIAIFDVAFAFNPGSNFVENDTMYFQQVFGCEYGYDDGTAEAAYGPQGTLAKLAYRFNVIQPDTLRAVRIHFEPNVNDVSNNLFYLTVWNADGPSGSPGTILYQNSSLFTPEYAEGNNAFWEYMLDEKVVVNGNYYIGWQQVDVEKLNIGFDLNTNTQNKIYYNVTGSWNNASFQGSLMMRPVFACGRDYTGVKENTETENNSVILFPNPATDQVTIQSEDDPAKMEVFDLSGRLIISEILNGDSQVDVGSLQHGIYLVAIHFSEGSPVIRKLIKH